MSQTALAILLKTQKDLLEILDPWLLYPVIKMQLHMSYEIHRNVLLEKHRNQCVCTRSEIAVAVCDTNREKNQDL